MNPAAILIESISADPNGSHSEAVTPLSFNSAPPEWDLETPTELPSGVASPDPLLGPSNRRPPIDRRALVEALAQSHHVETEPPLPDAMLELTRVRSRQVESIAAGRPSDIGLPDESGSPVVPVSQGVPPELANLAAEIVFVLVCTAGQILSAISMGQVNVTQSQLRDALGITPTQVPWLVGSSTLASGLSVIVFGAFADLAPPKPLMVGAFIWQAIWNIVCAFSIRPELKILFFISRAMQGLAVGILVSTTMSILGRVYSPGIRKTRVFSLMAAGGPSGYWFGCMQGGALSYHLPWIFGSTSILLALCTVAAYITIPPLRPAKDSADAEAPTLRQFDYLGAFFASTGSGLMLFGLTQGSSALWSPYTYTLVAVGILMYVAFYFVERRVARPLVPNGLWRTPGFAALLISFFLGYGAHSGAWQFYAIQFWQRYQGATPLRVALYLLPNGIVGVLATWTVSKTLHVFPGHWILTVSMVCFGMGPIFFLPQTPETPYWALSMVGVGLATFGPDMSFAAAAIFITSSVPRSYQGSAGSLLVTVQNLSVAIMTSIADSIGVKVDPLPTGEVGLAGLKAAWWFALAAALTGALITATTVRIPRAEEKEHVQ